MIMASCAVPVRDRSTRRMTPRGALAPQYRIDASAAFKVLLGRTTASIFLGRRRRSSRRCRRVALDVGASSPTIVFRSRPSVRASGRIAPAVLVLGSAASSGAPVHRQIELAAAIGPAHGPG